MPAKPRLGQNFLNDAQAIERIATSLGDLSGRTVVEIGPGAGAITSALLARASQVIAVELDPGLAEHLRARFSADKITVHQQDVLTFDFQTAAAQAGHPLPVFGNLPYYITSDILLKLFAASRDGLLGRAVLMMQREVADRLDASPGTREYGLLAATTQMHAEVSNLFTLPPEAFNPPPEVYSTVLRLEFAPRFAALGVDPNGFDSFLKLLFAQKRKTLHNNLRAAGFAPERIAAAWPESIPAQARAEAIALEPLAELYRALLPR
jgi:16S rRNA (adenine1518-N6/adenine1519-N6)-dimethyltransferase